MTTKPKVTWWCEPGFLPDLITLRAEVRFKDGARLYGSNLIPTDAEQFVLEDAIKSIECAFERHNHHTHHRKQEGAPFAINKPEVLAYFISHKYKWGTKRVGVRLLENHDPSCLNEEWNYEPLVRLSAYEAMQADRDQQHDMKVKAREEREEVIDKLSALHAECEKLRKDAERLDFITQNPGWLRSRKGWWECVNQFTNYSYPVFKTPREAIDSAMEEV